MPSSSARRGTLDLATASEVRVLGAVPVSAIVKAATILVGAAALLGPGAFVLLGPRVHPGYAVARPIPARVIPASQVPEVEPVALQDLSADDARAYNAAVPLDPTPHPAARPFRPAATGEDLTRAADCLATAELYEAGDDPPGERAVAQVVLNRVRHPAFPKTVCGVIFQGSERSTGCQFSFTCDGSMARHKPGEAAWMRARRIAAEALAGLVYRPVGLATHYHADYVVPYWQASLDKLAVVHTQIFYRWSGWWGSPAAFTGRADRAEPLIPAMAGLSPAHRTGPAALPGETGAATLAGATTASGQQAPSVMSAGAADGDVVIATLPADTDADLYPYLAHKACVGHARCKFMGWTDRSKTPSVAPLTAAQIATMSFSYLLDENAGVEKRLWNCAEFPQHAPAQCMKRQVMLTEPAPMSAAKPAVAEPLAGVRR